MGRSRISMVLAALVLVLAAAAVMATGANGGYGFVTLPDSGLIVADGADGSAVRFRVCASRLEEPDWLNRSDKSSVKAVVRTEAGTRLAVGLSRLRDGKAASGTTNGSFVSLQLPFSPEDVPCSVYELRVRSQPRANAAFSWRASAGLFLDWRAASADAGVSMEVMP